MPEAIQQAADAKRQAEETAPAATDDEPSKGKQAAASDIHVKRPDVQANSTAALAARLQGQPSLWLDCCNACVGIEH